MSQELSSLRRVAAVVAQGLPPRDIFAVMAEEAARAIEVPMAHIVRFDDDDDDAVTTCGAFSSVGPVMPVGTRWALADTSALRGVRTSSTATRRDDSSQPSDAPTEVDVRSSVAAPIVVAGRLWGAIGVSSLDPVPEHAEERLADFTELAAIAIAHAEAREALARLAEEQAALRRVATLVAQAVPPAEIFSAVTREVGRLFGSSAAALIRFDHGGSALLLAGISTSVEEALPIGTRWDSVDNPTASAEVYRTGRPARVDAIDWSSVRGAIGAAGRRVGPVSTVATPIVVERRAWGALSVSSTDDLLPLDAEERLQKFTELIATAIVNAESREVLGRLADEQAALRRVATQVAQGVRPDEVFSAVSKEVDDLFGLDSATVGRFDPDGPVFVILGRARMDARLPPGSRWDLNPLYASTHVYQTGRAARVEEADLDSDGGPISEMLRRQGFIAQVATPILVEGRLWGAIVLTATEPLPLDTEHRLAKFTELLATAIANADSRSELAASRRRIVAAADDARRRIERDLHDGTQQRLVSLGLAVRAAEASVPPNLSELRSALRRVGIGLADAVVELQEISRGIHPAILSHGGLGPALRNLARRSTIPVELNIRTDTRLREPIEVAVYFIASEALANAAKHARATRMEISLTTGDRALLLSIRDDGVGGADSAQGSGLVGLRDRVEALDGTISIESPPGGGTSLVATLPLDVGPAPGGTRAAE